MLTVSGLAASNYKGQDFYYHISGNKINIFTKDNIGRKILSFNPGNGKLEFIEEDNITDENRIFSIFYISNNKNIDYYIDNTWVAYEQNDDINEIDKKKSNFSLPSQFILHHEYSTSDKANLIPLKNNFTYKNEVSDSSLTYNLIAKPNFKNYTSLSTGFNQETGNDNIILTFTFNEQSYTLNEGDDLIFQIPALNDIESKLNDFDKETLYPYKSININDTNFIKNGSFGSDSPVLADKIKYFANSTKRAILKENDKTIHTTYLCSWLYNNEETGENIWLDRYYYPVISEKDATCKVCNLIDDYIETDENFRKNILENTIYDKKSDIVIQPDGIYKYSRISETDVDNIYSSLSPHRIENKISNTGAQTALDENINLDGKRWYKIQDEKLSNTNVMHFNADLYINPSKKMGIQLFGCDYTHGFNIQNRKDLSPYYYHADENKIYLLNNSNKICKTLDIYEKFGEKIKTTAGSTCLENIFIFLEYSLLILSYDLSIKYHISYTGILGFNKLFRGGQLLDATWLKNQIVCHDLTVYIPTENDVYALSITPGSLSKSTSFIITRLNEENEYIEFKSNSEKELTHSLYLDIINNKLYKFKGRCAKLASDKNTVFVISDIVDTNGYYTLYAYSLKDRQGSAYFKSKTPINYISTGPGDELLMIRGFNTAEPKPSDQKFEVFNKSRNIVYSYNLDNYTSVYSLSYYRFIDLNGVEHSTFKLLCANNTLVNSLLYHIDEEKVTTDMMALTANILTNNIINDNHFIKFSNENKLYFNLYLYDKCISTISWDISSMQAGWYNFDVNIDLNELIFKLKVNDRLISKNLITYTNDITHLDYNSTFNNTYYIGAVARKYGLPLSDILYNGVDDPYAAKNTKFRNMTIYNRSLKRYEQQASFLYYKNINPLILTIPCGIRNNIEEIIRYFKYNKVSSISNKIKINIAGLKDNLEEQNALHNIDFIKEEIKDIIKEEADCLVDVEAIEFI